MNYEKLVDNIIKDLIEEKDRVSDEIAEITTFVDLQRKDNSLTKWEIDYISKKRNELSTYYELIDDLEYLKERKKLKEMGELVWKH